MGWVQGRSDRNAVSGNSSHVILANPVGKGHFVILAFATANGRTLSDLGTVSVTDDKSNVYTLSDSFDDTTFDFSYAAVFFCSAITNGPQTITLSWTGVSTNIRIFVDEYVGVLQVSDPRDGHAINYQRRPANGTDVITSGNITTTVNRDIIWGFTLDTNDSNVVNVLAGTGYTRREFDATYVAATEDKIQTTAGVVAATFTPDINPAFDDFITAVMALKPEPRGWVQGASAKEESGAKTLSVTLPNPVISGSCVVVGAVGYFSSSFVMKVTDDKGNVYNVSDTYNDTSDGMTVSTFYLSYITNGPQVLTITFDTVGGTASTGSITVDEYAGVSVAPDPRDGHAINFQSNPSPTGTDGHTSGNITTTVDGDIIWGYIVNGFESGNNAIAGTGFIQRAIDVDSYFGWLSEDKIQSTAGSVAATFTASNDPYVTAVIALKMAPIGAMTVQKAFRQNVIKDQ